MPNTVQLKFDSEATDKLMEGVYKLAKAVGQTLGPRGRNVIMERPLMAPEVINDGVSIARKVVWLEDKFERQGALMILEAAAKTNEVAGDGTTTSTILAAEIADLGFQEIKQGYNPMKLRREIEQATEYIVKEVQKMAKPVKTREEIIQVGQISSESREVGEIIADIMDEIGQDGVIAVDDVPTEGMAKEIVKGMEFDQGLISPYLMEDTVKMNTTLDEPFILVTERKILHISDILPMIDVVGQNNTNQFVIIAEDIAPEAMGALITNKLKGTIRVIAVKAPGFGEARREHLEDIAALTGATVISESMGHSLKEVTKELLGRARQVTSDRSKTRIIQGYGTEEQVSYRVGVLKLRLEETASTNEKDRLQQRIAQLSGGIGVIKVGGFTEVEAKEKRLRVEDAIEATKAAVESGIVPGGGIALLRSIPLIPGDKGTEIVCKAALKPLKSILRNAGLEDETDGIIGVLRERPKSEGYDVSSDNYVDMFKAGIVDPAKVTVSALRNAASVASQLLTSGAAVIDNEK